MASQQILNSRDVATGKRSLQPSSNDRPQRNNINSVAESTKHLVNIKSDSLSRQSRRSLRGGSNVLDHPSHRIEKNDRPFANAVAMYGHLIQHNYKDNMEKRRKKCVSIIVMALIQESKTCVLSSNADTEDIDEGTKELSVMNMLTDILRQCLLSFGTGDITMREQLLTFLEETAEVTTCSCPWIDAVRRLMFHFLPLTFAEQDYEDAERIINLDSSSEPKESADGKTRCSPIKPDLMKTFRCLIQKQPSNTKEMQMLFLKCLSNLPLITSEREEIRSYVSSLLICTSSSGTEVPPRFVGFAHELAEVVSVLLDLSWTEQEAKTTIRTLRDSCRIIDKQNRSFNKEFDSAVVLALIQIAQLLATSVEQLDGRGPEISIRSIYLDLLNVHSSSSHSRETGQSSEFFLVELDLVFLLILEHKQGGDLFRLMDGWISKKCFPFDTLFLVTEAILAFEQDSQRSCLVGQSVDEAYVIIQCVMLALFRLAIHLVANVDWEQAQLNTKEKTIEFAINLDQSTSLYQTSQLFRMLVATWQSLLTSAGSNGNQKQLTTIRQVGFVLEELARNRSQSMVQLQKSMIDPFAKDLFSKNLSDEAMGTCCRILAVSGHEYLCILESLLFPGVQLGVSDWRRRGLLLATEMIKYGRKNQGLVKIVQSTVNRVILPPQRKMVDSELGSHAVRFLDELRCAEESCTESFETFQMMLSNTGLIQSLSRYKKQRKRRKYQSILLTPRIDEKNDNGAIVFCVAHFIRSLSNGELKSDRLIPITKWIYELVDAYLRFGRSNTATRWKPTIWLGAPIDFPTFVNPFSYSSEQKFPAMEWIDQEICGGNIFGDSEAEQCSDDLRTRLVELFTQDAVICKAEEVAAVIKKHTLALYVAIVICSAVLKNAFEYYKSLSENEKSRNSILEHVGSQFEKIFKIKKKIAPVDLLLSALITSIRNHTKSCKSNGDNTDVAGNTSRISKADLSSLWEQVCRLREALSSLDKEIFASSKFFPRSALWECLNNQTHDKALKQQFQCILSANVQSANSEMFRIVKLRSQIIDQLLLLSGSLERDTELHVSACIQATLTITYVLRDIKTLTIGSSLISVDQSTFATLHNLSVGYLKLSLNVLSRFHQTRRPDLSKKIIRSFSKSLGKKESDQTGIVRETLCLIRGSDDAQIANGLLEMLTYLLADGCCLAHEMMVEGSMALWPLAHYKIDCSINISPYTMITIQQSLHASASSMELVNKLLAQTVCRRDDVRHSKVGHVFGLQRFWLLRHFGLIYRSKMTSKLFERHMFRFAAELVSLVNALSRRKQDGIAPTTAPNKKSPNSLTSTFPEIFEALIHIAVASFTLFQPGKESCVGPYSSLSDAAILFRVLVSCYRDNLLLFPRRIVMVVFRAARLILEATTMKLDECLAWRSQQPIPKTPGKQDPGSLKHLEMFIDVLASCVCESLFELCGSWACQEEVSNIEAKGKNLLAAVEKSSDILQETAVSHSIASPRFDVGNSFVSSRMTISDNHPGANRSKKKRRVSLSMASDDL